ncbi:MAG: DnaB-like helicase C-terminal domain-containing protein [Clostridia bacterium]
MKIIFNELPKYLQTNRKSYEGTVLGCVINDIYLLKEYDLTTDLFITKEGELIFTILNKLSEENVSKVTDTDIRLNCNGEIIKEYLDMGGFKCFEILAKTTTSENFESYLDKLLLHNLLINLYNDGMDLEKKIVIKSKKGQIKLSWMELSDKMTTDEFLNYYQNRSNEYIDISYVANDIHVHEGELGENFLEGLYSGEKVGMLFDKIGEQNFCPYLSKELLGFKKKQVSAISATVNAGKTTFLTQLAMSLASKGNKVLVISNEMEISDFFVSFLTYIIYYELGYRKINKKKLQSGGLSEEDKKYVELGRKYYNEHYSDKIILTSIADANMKSVEKTLKKYVLKSNIDILLYDTMKGSNLEREQSYKNLIMDSRTFLKLSKLYNVAIIFAMQQSQTYSGELFLSISQLAEAKQVNEVLSTLLCMRQLYKEELDPNNRFYIEPFRRVKTPEGKWKEEKVKLDEKGNYRCVFITKSRSCSTSSETGECVILNFNGFSGGISELCLGRPKRGNINQQNNKFGKK